MSPNVSAPRGTDTSRHAASADKIERSEDLMNILRTGRKKKSENKERIGIRKRRLLPSIVSTGADLICDDLIFGQIFR